MTTLKELLNRPSVKLPEVALHLNNLNHPERVAQVLALSKKEQVKLWEIAEKSKPLTLEYVVPRDAQPLQFFPFEGKNSLPAFTHFQKVFYLDQDRNVCGYNNASIGWLVGPGYYMAQMNPKAPEFEIQVDYTRIPTEHPPAWPEIKSNDVIPTRFVYGGTKDNLRYVTKDVLIGRAFKMGESPMPNWFVLCRQTPAPGDGEKQ
ncbi:MAG TPA: hypothetical protein VM658_09990 [bacterium]|nr:hypothetical protein [bacterium]